MCQPKWRMEANAEVIRYQSKPLKDGTYPLMLRVTKGRNRKYVSLWIFLDERFWDFEKYKPNELPQQRVNRTLDDV